MASVKTVTTVNLRKRGSITALVGKMEDPLDLEHAILPLHMGKQIVEVKVDEAEEAEREKEKDYTISRKRSYRRGFKTLTQLVIEDSTPRDEFAIGVDKHPKGLQLRGNVETLISKKAMASRKGSNGGGGGAGGDEEEEAAPFKYVIMQAVKRVVDGKTVSDVNVIPCKYSKGWIKFTNKAIAVEKFLHEVDEDADIDHERKKKMEKKWNKLLRRGDEKGGDEDGDDDVAKQIKQKSTEDASSFTYVAPFGKKKGKKRGGAGGSRSKFEVGNEDDKPPTLDEVWGESLNEFQEYGEGENALKFADNDDGDYGEEQMALDLVEESRMGAKADVEEDDFDDDDEEEEEEEEVLETGRGGATTSSSQSASSTGEKKVATTSSVTLITEELTEGARQAKKQWGGGTSLENRQKRERKLALAAAAASDEEGREKEDADDNSSLPPSKRGRASPPPPVAPKPITYELSDAGVRKCIEVMGGKVTMDQLKSSFIQVVVEHGQAIGDKRAAAAKFKDIVLRVTENYDDPIMGVVLRVRGSGAT